MIVHCSGAARSRAGERGVHPPLRRGARTLGGPGRAPEVGEKKGKEKKKRERKERKKKKMERKERKKKKEGKERKNGVIMIKLRLDHVWALLEVK